MSDDALLSSDEERDLAGVLDEIIPPSEDGRLPGAGELGLTAAIERAMNDTPDLRPAVAQGLAALHELVESRGPGDFASLSREKRRGVLNELATLQPAFLPGLIFHVYAHYYRDGRVLEALGLEPRPPHPLGYELETGDLSLLDPVRDRPKLYRR
ncbi:MAG: gluconate 2-dehydrogenase subunit 3 family protein [Proteobacteria bacterium]|nr:gluconate 2-dehydrogenase subunit 3 family protein [Pseudomonadota bacterium]